MATILAFAGSNSSTSINYKLVNHTIDLVKEHDCKLINLANYPFPMYSHDEEKDKGFINSLIELKDYFIDADAIILSVNEHNGGPSAYFKNVLDWISRVDIKFLADKKIFLMATSPGKRGAIGALESIEKLLPRFGGEVVSTFSLPSFDANFSEANGISDAVLAKQHQNELSDFLSKL
ncbi:NAD(P)H-dependent oxidoreductase [Cellulophaga sp. HaHaR_3_176]|uniref:NADPH-dependent FMN reductase n=1 Tax=Cellulophaga sp. HaHaR_3_176 TaxID=1942464 RepID=UPI001C1FC712|nr:NAD(P)H-dependent oxidoreductase [Cellulophaga sp. HaHaR_3_176]QWX85058.1 NAD(P)H-dependent oxidoreductase [Cellulophaga sp. HaHaR_3_176]